MLSSRAKSTWVYLTKGSRVRHGELSISTSTTKRLQVTHDDRPLDMRCHLPDDLLVERPRVGTGTDQHSRLDSLDNCMFSTTTFFFNSSTYRP